MTIARITVAGALLLSAYCRFAPSLAHSQDAPEPSGGEHGCVALTRGLWVDVFEKRNAEAAHRYVDDTYIQHSPPPQPKGDKWIALWAGVYATPPTGPGKNFPEAQPGYTTQIVSIVGDEVLALLEARDTWTWGSGKHKGKHASSHYYDMFRCQGGKVVEHWYVPYQPPQ